MQKIKEYSALQKRLLHTIRGRKYSELQTVGGKEYNRLYTILLTIYTTDKTTRGREYSILYVMRASSRKRRPTHSEHSV